MSVRNIIMVAASQLGDAEEQYLIERSLKFDREKIAYTEHYPASSGPGGILTISVWVKRSRTGVFSPIWSSGTSSPRSHLNFNSADRLEWRHVDSSETAPQLLTTAFFRDTTGWYHIVAQLDTSQATSSNRMKLWVNGQQITDFSTASYPSQYIGTYANARAGEPHGLGLYKAGGGGVTPTNAGDGMFAGYIADFHFLPGQALTADSFGEINATTGVWSPIEFTGTFDKNSVHYKFNNATSIKTIVYDSVTRTKDEDYDKTVLLLNANGTNGANNNTFVDSSTNNFTVTRAGNATQGSFSPFSQDDGKWSVFVENQQIAWDKTAFLSLSQRTFTIDFWIKPTAVGATGGSIIYGVNKSGRADSIWVSYSSTRKIGMQNAGSGFTSFFSNSDVPLNEWTHVAITVSGTSGSATGRIYLNGILDQVATGLNTTIPDVGSNAYTGTRGDSTFYAYYGYLSNFRIIKDEVLYSSNFSVPTEPSREYQNDTSGAGTETVVLIYQTPYLTNRGSVNNGPTALVGWAGKVTAENPFLPSSAYSANTNGGSVFFDKSGDWLVVPTGAVSSIGTGDYTIDCWCYPRSFTISSLFQRLWSFGTGLADDVTLNVNTSGNVVHRINDAVILSSSNTLRLNSWNHVVLSRSSGTVGIWINGESGGTTPNSTNINTQGSSGNLRIGSEAGASTAGSSGDFDGYISGFRVIKGASRVANISESDIPVPQRPLLISSGTNLIAASEDFNFGDASYGYNRTRGYVLSNATIAPNGSLTADKWVETTQNGPHQPSQVVSGTTNSSTYTFSAYIKAGERTKAVIVFRENPTFTRIVTARIDLVAGTISSVENATASGGATVVATSITNEGNGWYRASISATLGGSDTQIQCWVGLLNNSDSSSYTGDGTSGLFLWGYQLEPASSVGTYFPTPMASPSASTGALLNFTNAGIYDETGKQVFETIGDSQIDTGTKKFGSGSLEFDGTGDYIEAPPTKELVDWTGSDLTIEYWAYVNAFDSSANGGSPALSQSNPASTSEYFSFGPIGDGKIRWYYFNGSVQNITTSFSISTGRWYHLAFVYRKNLNRGYIYVDGIPVADAAINGTPSIGIDDASSRFLIGRSTSGGEFNGFIDDVRITKAARYSSLGFTPPAQQFAYNVSDVSYKQFGVNALSVSNTNYTSGWSSESYYSGQANSFPWGTFDGSIFTIKSLLNTSQTWTAPGGGLAFNSLFQMRVHRESGQGTVSIVHAGGTTDVSSQIASTTNGQVTAGTLPINTITGITSPITSITFTTSSSYQLGLQAIIVDGQTLVDDVSTSSVLDSPTSYGTDTGVGGQVRGNYSTWQSLQQAAQNTSGVVGDSVVTFSEGNLKTFNTSNGGFAPRMQAFSTFGMRDGKWYAEFTHIVNRGVGIAKGVLWASSGNAIDSYVTAGDSSASIGNGASGTESGSAVAFGINDVLGVAFDADNSTITFYKNNTQFYQVTSLTSTNPNLDWLWVTQPNSSSGISNAIANFGQFPFRYTAPNGFKACCSLNTTTPITQPNDYFKSLAYAGNNDRVVSGVGFQPDMVWIKTRNFAYNHQIHDSLRGPTAGLLIPNSTSGQDNTYQLDSFDADGITTDAGNVAGVDNVYNHVMWSWKAVSSTSTNNNGTKQTETRANPTAGFSIVKWVYTGSNSMGHGLGAVPKAMFIRGLDRTYNWDIYHHSIGPTKRLLFNSTTTPQTFSGPFGDTTPTSTVFYQGSEWYTTNDNLIGYIFAEIEGYSKFDKYVGNGNVNGPVIYTGFRPSLLIIKSITDVESWVILDNARSPYNVNDDSLLVNANNTENLVSAARTQADFLSNGFKLRGAGDASQSITNKAASEYVYFAWAENPFKYSLGV